MDKEQVKIHLGERLRAVRKRRGFTLREVAGRAGVSESLVSQIERGRVAPAIDTLLGLADILEIDFDYLFHDLKRSRSVNVVRAGERSVILRDGVRYERLSRTPEEHEEYGIEAYYMEISPGSSSGSRLYGHQGKELGTIIEGRGELTIGTETVTLGPGDSISFASDIPHLLKNTGEEPLVAYWAVTPPKPFDVDERP